MIKAEQKDLWAGRAGMRKSRKRKTVMDGSCCCDALRSHSDK